MSIDRNVYVGPYIEILDTQQTYRISRNACPNQSCDQYEVPVSDGNYCSVCGNKLTATSFKEKGDLDIYGLLIQAGDSNLLSVATHELQGGISRYFLLSNHQGQGGIHAKEWQDVIEFTPDKMLPKGDDWQKVEDVLTANKIRYRRSVGLVVWTS